MLIILKFKGHISYRKKIELNLVNREKSGKLDFEQRAISPAEVGKMQQKSNLSVLLKPGVHAMICNI